MQNCVSLSDGMSISSICQGIHNADVLIDLVTDVTDPGRCKNELLSTGGVGVGILIFTVTLDYSEILQRR